MITVPSTGKFPAYSVVVGQIHAGTQSDKSAGFGWGNEPLKIYFKKYPKHQYGSVFWTYEGNLPKEDINRTGIAYPVGKYVGKQ
ncbi:MAG: polysaccharide lyase family 7 protein [Thalassotalea sp.]